MNSQEELLFISLLELEPTKTNVNCTSALFTQLKLIDFSICAQIEYIFSGVNLQQASGGHSKNKRTSDTSIQASQRAQKLSRG